MSYKSYFVYVIKKVNNLFKKAKELHEYMHAINKCVEKKTLLSYAKSLQKLFTQILIDSTMIDGF